MPLGMPRRDRRLNRAAFVTCVSFGELDITHGFAGGSAAPPRMMHRLHFFQ